MAALAEMNLDTQTPEQAAATRQALAALERLRADNEAECKRIRDLEHLNLELIRRPYDKRSEKLSADYRPLTFEEFEAAYAEVEASPPARLIEGVPPSASAVAYVLYSKYADLCPLYRQAGIHACSSLEMDNSTSDRWIGKTASHLGPVYDHLKAALKVSNNPGLDETTVRLLASSRGMTKTGYLWTMRRNEHAMDHGGPTPGVAYGHTPRRSGKYGESVLRGFGIMVDADGYVYHNHVQRAPVPAAFWSGARRDLKTDADSNFVENRIRPIKPIPQHTPFASHDDGVRPQGRIASLIETCKMNAVELYVWLSTMLAKLADGQSRSTSRNLRTRITHLGQNQSAMLVPRRLRSSKNQLGMSCQTS